MTSPKLGSNPTRTRHICQVLRHIWAKKSVSRANIARHTDLSRASITNITNQLLSMGLIMECQQEASRGGRPATPLKVSPNRFQIIGIDMGSSHIHVHSMNLNAEIIKDASCSFDSVNNPLEAIQKIIKLCHSCLAPNMPLLGIGLAAPSPVHNQELNPEILPKWVQVPIREHLQQAFHAPVFIDNDANLGALAEQWWGHGAGIDSFIFIKMGTGIGAGIVSEQNLLRGVNGYAGEIGHIFLRGDAQCRCGRLGCLEAYIGTNALIQRSKNAPLRSSLHQTEHRINDILTCALTDKDAQTILSDTVSELGTAIGNLINITNPKQIILWGEMINTSSIFIDLLRQNIHRYSNWAKLEAKHLYVSSFGEDAITIGASTLVLEEALKEPSLFTRNIFIGDQNA